MLARKLQPEEQYEEKKRRQHIRRPAQPRLSVTERRQQLNVGLRRQCFTLLIITSIFAIAITALSIVIASNEYNLAQIKSAAVKVEMENSQLEIDNAKLKAPGRIQAMAAQDFGMGVPQQVYFASGQGE